MDNNYKKSLASCVGKTSSVVHPGPCLRFQSVPKISISTANTIDPDPPDNVITHNLTSLAIRIHWTRDVDIDQSDIRAGGAGRAGKVGYDSSCGARRGACYVLEHDVGDIYVRRMRGAFGCVNVEVALV